MNYKVFVSYSWSNSAERRALESELSRVTGIVLLVDRQFIKPGDKIHERIGVMIDASDCIVVLLTPEGLRSVEVRDELSRCHERGKRIVPVVTDGTNMSGLPWYLRDIHFINYREREFDRVVEEVVGAIRSFANPIVELDSSTFPASIKSLLDSGSRLIVVAADSTHAASRPLSEYLVCALAMRQTDAVVVFAAHPKTTVELAATILANDLFPHLDRKDYIWQLVKDNQHIPEYFTLEAANIKSGDKLLLLGNHQMPEWAPCAQ